MERQKRMRAGRQGGEQDPVLDTFHLHWRRDVQELSGSVTWAWGKGLAKGLSLERRSLWVAAFGARSRKPPGWGQPEERRGLRTQRKTQPRLGKDGARSGCPALAPTERDIHGDTDGGCHLGEVLWRGGEPRGQAPSRD